MAVVVKLGQYWSNLRKHQEVKVQILFFSHWFVWLIAVLVSAAQSESVVEDVHKKALDGNTYSHQQRITIVVILCMFSFLLPIFNLYFKHCKQMTRVSSQQGNGSKMFINFGCLLYIEDYLNHI